ncbi:MAG: hypothetical protein Q4F00_14255, partial [bacterium]|nr:hypothetical protein [bacterium]
MSIGASGMNTLLSSSAVSNTILQNTIDAQKEEIKKEEEAKEAEQKETAKAKEAEAELKYATNSQNQKLLEIHEKISNRMESILRGDKGAAENAGHDAESLMSQMDGGDDFSPEILQRLRDLSHSAKQSQAVPQESKQTDFAEQTKRSAQQLRDQLHQTENQVSGRAQQAKEGTAN